MAITIKPALRKNPQDKAAAAKYYAQVVLAPEMTQKQIVEQIADRCTLTGSDIKAVLDACYLRSLYRNQRSCFYVCFLQSRSRYERRRRQRRRRQWKARRRYNPGPVSLTRQPKRLADNHPLDTATNF